MKFNTSIAFYGLHRVEANYEPRSYVRLIEQRARLVANGGGDPNTCDADEQDNALAARRLFSSDLIRRGVIAVAALRMNKMLSQSTTSLVGVNGALAFRHRRYRCNRRRHKTA